MSSSDDLKALGNAAFAAKQYRKAAKIYRDAIALKELPVLYSNRAQCFIYLEDWDRALRDTNRGLALDAAPNIRVKLLYRKAVVFHHTGEPEQAKAALEEAITIDPSNGPVLSLLREIDNKRVKVDQEIVVEHVEVLPDEFQRILDGERVAAVNVDEEAEALLGSRRKTRAKPETNSASSPSESIKSASSPSESPRESVAEVRRRLALIPTLSPQDLPEAYTYVLSIPSAVYGSIFSRVIDTEFLAFYIDAVAHTADRARAFDVLNEFSTYKRYAMSLEFCSRESIKRIIEENPEFVPLLL